MCPSTDLWEPWAGNRPGPPGNIRGNTNRAPAPKAELENMAFFGLCKNVGENIFLALTAQGVSDDRGRLRQKISCLFA